MTTPPGPQGFTLVEGIVTCLLAVIVGAIVFTIMDMNNRGVSDGALNTRIQMQYETVVSQICQTARFANAILDGSSGESWSSSLHLPTVTSTKIIKLYDNLGAWIGGYQIVSPTTLQEYDAAPGQKKWINFKVGINDVSVTSGSSFSLSGDRKWVTLNLSVFSSFSSLKDTVVSKGEIFTCRN